MRCADRLLVVASTAATLIVADPVYRLPAVGQTQEDVDRVNKWFEQNKPKDWTPTVGDIQKPGEIQQPKGIQAIKIEQSQCQRRLAIGADVLFQFDKAELSADAEETLGALGPLIKDGGDHPVLIEGHTDAIGSDEYNLGLSERRARAVRDWLVAHQFAKGDSAIAGYGERRPLAPNAKPDGSDDPAGRQKNRRVEAVIDTCR